MDVGNPFEVVVHYLLIGEMTNLDHQDGVPMVSALVCVVTYWIRPMMSRSIGYYVVMISPSYYTI